MQSHHFMANDVEMVQADQRGLSVIRAFAGDPVICFMTHKRHVAFCYFRHQGTLPGFCFYKIQAGLLRSGLFYRHLYNAPDDRPFNALKLHYLERLSRSVYDLILKLLIEVSEIIGVAGHAHDKILVIIRMLLCLQKCFLVEYIELDVMSVHSEVCADQAGQVLKSGISCKSARSELLVKKCSACLVPNWARSASRLCIVTLLI